MQTRARKYSYRLRCPFSTRIPETVCFDSTGTAVDWFFTSKMEGGIKRKLTRCGLASRFGNERQGWLRNGNECLFRSMSVFRGHGEEVVRYEPLTCWYSIRVVGGAARILARGRGAKDRFLGHMIDSISRPEWHLLEFARWLSTMLCCTISGVHASPDKSASLPLSVARVCASFLVTRDCPIFFESFPKGARPRTTLWRSSSHGASQ